MVTRESPAELTAARFVSRLEASRSEEERRKFRRYFPDDDGFIGVRMGQVFALAKEFIDLPIPEIETLLESPIHEARAGACSIMGKSAAARKTGEQRREELYELYLRRHDRISSWDLVDLAARDVVGVRLIDRPREPLYALARSGFWPERRTAIVATSAFIRIGEVSDAIAIAELLLADPEDLVHKATGWMLRYAGDTDRAALIRFLDSHAAAMPRVMLRYSIEHLDPDARAHYLGTRTTG